MPLPPREFLIDNSARKISNDKQEAGNMAGNKGWVESKVEDFELSDHL